MTGDQYDDDVRAILAAGRLRGTLDKATRLDNTSKHCALRSLGKHSPDVRRWTRWAAAGTVVFPLAPLIMGFGVQELFTRTGFVLPLAGIVGGATAMAVLAVGLWQVGQQTLDLAVGTYLECTPPFGEPGEAD